MMKIIQNGQKYVYYNSILINVNNQRIIQIYVQIDHMFMNSQNVYYPGVLIVDFCCI